MTAVRAHGRAAVVALGVCVAVLAGCTSSTSGTAQPTPDDPTRSAVAPATTTTASRAPATTTTISRPPVSRQSVVDVAQTDPCSLVSDAQRAALGLDARPSAGPEPVSQGRLCAFGSRSTTAFYGVVVSAKKSAQDFAGTTSVRTSTPTVVVGFPAYVVTDPTSPGGCQVAVDVADGQLLDVQRDDRTGPTTDQICSATQLLTESVMTTLLAQQ